MALASSMAWAGISAPVTTSVYLFSGTCDTNCVGPASGVLTTQSGFGALPPSFMFTFSPAGSLASTAPSSSGGLNVVAAPTVSFDFGPLRAFTTNGTTGFVQSASWLLTLEQGAWMLVPVTITQSLASSSGSFSVSASVPLSTYSGTSGSFALAPVPEPQTWAMLVGGLGLVSAAVRRRRLSRAAA